MKLTKSHSHDQRRVIDKKLESISSLKKLTPPRLGWIKSIRESLGLSTHLLAKRLKVSQSVITRMEARESKKQVTLEMLDRVAQSMDCKLIYAIVPLRESLEEILELRSMQTAERILGLIKHTMRLEDQTVNHEETLHQLKTLAKELKETLDHRIWEDQ